MGSKATLSNSRSPRSISSRIDQPNYLRMGETEKATLVTGCLPLCLFRTIFECGIYFRFQFSIVWRQGLHLAKLL